MEVRVLPLQQKATSIKQHVLRSRDSNTQHRIMIVEDDQGIAQIFAITLQDNGFAVDVFNDPLDALSNYKAGHYDLLLLDIRMPGMNGFELYQKIKEIDDEVQVCFITARVDAIDEFRRLFPYLEVDMDNLVKIVKSKVDYKC